MAPILLLLFIGVPILEIAVFIRVGDLIGLWPTLATVVLTAMAGTALLRHQGLSTLAKARANLDAGAAPVKEIFDGVCLLVGGVLLLTPGFVTDTMGLLLLIPPVRDALRRFLAKRVKTQVHMGGTASPFRTGPVPPRDPNPPRDPTPPGVIDGDFVDVTPADGSPNDSSPWARDPRDPPGSGG